MWTVCTVAPAPALNFSWGVLAVQRKVVRSAGFQPALTAITLQAGCLRYTVVMTLGCTASGSFHMSLRVKPSQLDPCVVGLELPVDGLRPAVAIAIPQLDSRPQGRLVSDPFTEALFLQHA